MLSGGTGRGGDRPEAAGVAGHAELGPGQVGGGGLLSLGKSDFEAIEPFRGDRFFKEAPGLAKVPGSVDALTARCPRAELRELTDELSLRLLERTEAPITAHKGYVCADLTPS